MSGIFLSYRRSTSKHFARSIFDALRQHGHDVFLDVNSIDAGAFDSIIRNQIAARPHFLLILSTGALERCANEKDWLRLEIEEAFRLNRNIVPIYDEGFDLSREIGYLPEPIRTELPLKNAPPFVHYYFDAFIQTLSERFFKDAVDNVSITPTPAAEQAEVQKRIEQAAQPNDGQETEIESPPTRFLPADQDNLFDLIRRTTEIKHEHELVPPTPSHPQMWGVENILPQPFEWVYIPEGNLSVNSSINTFNISKYPITNAQFETFIQAKDGYDNPNWWKFRSNAGLWRDSVSAPHPRAFPEDNDPRVNVNFFEAMAFCKWLENRFNSASPILPHQRISLPSTDQWDRAAYGDIQHLFPWGNEFDILRCNIKESNVGRSTPVNFYPSGQSIYGVMDMIGNVSEWCFIDAYQKGTNDLLAASTLRGCNWTTPQADIRSKVLFVSPKPA